MKAKLLTLLLALAAIVVASADAMDSKGTLGHVNPGDRYGPDGLSKPDDYGKPYDHGNLDDYGKPYDRDNPDDYGKAYDHGKPDHNGKPGDRGKGTIIVTAIGSKGRPASGASIFMDGRLVGSTNLQGKLTIPNVSPGEHRISASKTSWRESLRGSAQIRVQGKQTVQTCIRLIGRWR
jgi:hypothetical protein